ncbi:hypothetical protein N6H14_29590 [Paenibacillus sp. CC-CFT747]|nr:hypothetical protein N6H14_29590 [Paenibacillus sp. CC-CFT747]
MERGRESLLPAGTRLTAVVHRLLEKNPQDRYSSAFDLKVDLDRLLYQTEAEREGNAGGSGSIPRKLIAIGSLYPGAGSTYISLALCHTLRQLKVAHALVESASVKPELYSLLYGDRYAPKDYKPLVTRVEEGTEGEHNPWRSGLTEWVPLHPDRSPAGWSKEKLYRLLHAVKTDITIVDISTGWEHEEAVELCDRADLVVVVAGPHPGKLGSPSSRELRGKAGGTEGGRQSSCACG